MFKTPVPKSFVIAEDTEQFEHTRRARQQRRPSLFSAWTRALAQRAQLARTGDSMQAVTMRITWSFILRRAHTPRGPPRQVFARGLRAEPGLPTP